MHHKIKQLIMNQRGKRSAKTYTTGTLSTLWGPNVHVGDRYITSMGQQENKNIK